MKHMIGVLANFGKQWLVDRGWRRTVALIVTVAVYDGLHLAAFLADGFPTLVLTTNFFLIMVAGSLLGLLGALSAATLSGILAGPFPSYFILPSSPLFSIHWGYRFLVTDRKNNLRPTANAGRQGRGNVVGWSLSPLRHMVIPIVVPTAVVNKWIFRGIGAPALQHDDEGDIAGWYR